MISQLHTTDIPANNLVAVAMSGGVDSSVAACLLQEQGWKIVGVTMKLRRSLENSASDENRSCCTLDSALDARRVCEQLGVAHYTLDLVEEFGQQVVDPFVDAYLQGRTPNPCVACNSFLKWDALWQLLRKVGATHLATGHYASLRKLEDGPILLARAQDAQKDQSYFLWGISPLMVEKTLFPIAHLNKSQVRTIAARHGLRTAHKAESQDICFIPDGNKDRFLREALAVRGLQSRPGPIVDQAGKVVGEHPGLAFFTIGQRKGLGIATGYPAFVTRLDIENNTLVVGALDAARKDCLQLSQCNWFVDPARWRHESVFIQVRFRSKPIACQVEWEQNRAQVWLEEAAFGVTPGQSAVFYYENMVLGGGIIC